MLLDRGEATILVFSFTQPVTISEPIELYPSEPLGINLQYCGNLCGPITCLFLPLCLQCCYRIWIFSLLNKMAADLGTLYLYYIKCHTHIMTSYWTYRLFLSYKRKDTNRN